MLKNLALAFFFLIVLNLQVMAEDSTTEETSPEETEKVARYQEKVQKDLNKFIKSIGKDPKQYTIIVQQSDELNAYATLGRKIVVYTALIENLENDSALNFVLAHELGHIEERHAINGVARQGFFALLRSIFFKESRYINVYDGVTYMGGLHYSRGAEKEADKFAIELMNDLYCDVPNKLEFFEKNAANQKASKLSEYFSTHPLDSTRLEYLKEHIKEAGCVI